LLVAVVAGCGGGRDTITEEAAREPSTRTAASEAPQEPKKGSWGAVFAAENESGIMLFDLSGHTLYRFDGDKGAESTCYGTCAKAWPPALTEGKIRAVDVSASWSAPASAKTGPSSSPMTGTRSTPTAAKSRAKAKATGLPPSAANGTPSAATAKT